MIWILEIENVPRRFYQLFITEEIRIGQRIVLSDLIVTNLPTELYGKTVVVDYQKSDIYVDGLPCKRFEGVLLR